MPESTAAKSARLGATLKQLRGELERDLSLLCATSSVEAPSASSQLQTLKKEKLALAAQLQHLKKALNKSPARRHSRNSAPAADSESYSDTSSGDGGAAPPQLPPNSRQRPPSRATYPVELAEHRLGALRALFSHLATVRDLSALCRVSKAFYTAACHDALWSTAMTPYRALLDHYYCYDMVFECLGTDEWRLSTRQCAVTLARLFAVDEPTDAYGQMRLLDRGAESIVYLAPRIDADSYRRDASGFSASTDALVKAMRFSAETLQNQRMRLREVALLARCRHESIIGIGYTRFRLSDGTMWVELEHMAGGNVADKLIMNEVRLTEPQTAEVLLRVVQGIGYMHAHGLYHRDLKTDNLLLALDGTVKIGDFGYAAEIGTDNNALLGTPYWMPPEVVLKRDYSSPVDIWSMGICGIEMIDGEPPYMCDNPIKAMFHICSQDPPTLAQPDKQSPEINDFLAKCLVKSPADRAKAADLLTHSFLRKAGGKNVWLN